MSPTLRSTNNTPTKASNTPTVATPAGTPTTTPRKAPQCSKCKRPRVGHPRSGCPFVDSVKDTDDDIDDSPIPGVTKALGSMKLASSPTKKRLSSVNASPGKPLIELEDTKAAIRNRRRSQAAQASATLVPAESLASLSTNSSQIVANLLQIGLDDSDAEDEVGEKREKVVRWQTTAFAATAVGKFKSGAQTSYAKALMPGTFKAPSPDHSFQGAETGTQAEDSPLSSVAARPSSFTSRDQSGLPPTQPESPARATQSSSPTASYTSRRPLSRTMSMEEQSLFINGLREKSKAVAYVLPMANIAAVQSDAMRIGLHSHLVSIEEEGQAEVDEGLLVIGRDGKAVLNLSRKLEAEARKHVDTGGKGGLRAAAGGVVLGAAATFAGLAFS